MKTLILNLNHAARNGESVTIGGGEFSAEEIRAAVKQFEELKKASQLALEAMAWDIGGEPLPSLEIEASKALRSILNKL